MQKEGYNRLVSDIGSLLEQGRRQAVSAVNTAITIIYWQIGRRIVEFEQKGKFKADYGAKLLEMLSNDLKCKYGRGFSVDSLERMRRFYINFKISATALRKLSWSHYIMLLRVNNEKARQFYIEYAEQEHWGARELERNINSMLYERTALSKDKKAVLAKAKGTAPTPEEQVKDPYVLEFLNLKEEKEYSESQIEQALID